MPVRSRSTGWIHASAAPWRVVAHRFSFVIFMSLALGLIVFGRVEPSAVDRVRIRTMDSVAPVMDAFSRPLTSSAHALAEFHSYFSLREENAKLKQDSSQLKEWQNAAATLEHENRELRALLRFKTEPRFAYISARVIADTGGPFSRSLIVTAGKLDGVREGMAAMTGDGLIGRVVDAGDWSSRVLLITDLNSRIPVTILGSGDRAILAGDNSSSPRLMYLAQDAAPQNGAQIVTSGHGGIFPANLPVGNLVDNGHGKYTVAAAADLGRVDYVRLVDFNLNGGAFNPVAAKISAETKKR